MDKAIRVLHVVTHMNRGGLESTIMNYYRNIDRTKVQFDFLTHRPKTEKKDYDDEILSFGGRIYHLPKLNPFSIIYLKKLNEFFEEHREYKIVHVHQDCLSGIILKTAKNCGVPVRIAHCHSSSQDKGFKYCIKNICKRNIKTEATKLFACGRESGRWMFNTNNFEVLPNAINAERYRFNDQIRKEIRESLHMDDSFVIGHIGRFSKVKNHVFLISVFEEILKIENKAKLVLVGDGDDKEHIKKLVQDKNLRNYVIFTGIRTDINALVQAFDIFVLPSLYEGLPVTMIEAQAAGLPCFISDKVPIECKITENVYPISLDKAASFWAKQICQSKGLQRKDTYSQIENANYDIKKNACYLQNYYLSAMSIRC